MERGGAYADRVWLSATPPGARARTAQVHYPTARLPD